MRARCVIGLATTAALLASCAGKVDRSGWAGALDPLGGEPTVSQWRASTFAAGKQVDAALDAGPDGTIYTVWSSKRPRYGVYAQRFDANGIAVGEEMAVSIWPEGMAAAPCVAAVPGGGAWAAWQSFGQDGDEGAIIARRFDAAFVGGSEVLVNQHAQGNQTAPVCAVSGDGTAAFAWMSSVGETAAEVWVRVFKSDGTAACDEFPVMAVAGGACRTPSIAAGPDGTFAVAYAAFDSADRPGSIVVQRFDRTGRLLGEARIVSGASNGSQVEPSIAGTRDGFVIAWIDSATDGSEYGVVAQRLARDGTPVGGPVLVNETVEGTQFAISATGLPGGGFAIAWNGPDGDGHGVFARAYSADGVPAGGEVALTGLARGDQEMSMESGARRLAAVGAGRLACAWVGKSAQVVEGGEPIAPGRDSRDKEAARVALVAFDGFDGAGVRQGVTAGMAIARGDVGAAEPHRPPTFDPKTIGSGRRRFLNDGAGGFDAVINTGWTPPDPHMAVGPEHIICMTNGAIRFFLKNGQQTFADEIEGAQGFWGGLGATGFVFDPEVVYDALSGRYFAMAAEAYAPGNKSYVLIAVSDDSDPNGTWYKYRFDTSGFAGDLFDSPNIGVTDNEVVVTGDGFGKGANYPVYIWDKASLLAGNPPAISKSLTLQTTTQSAGYPPVTFDSPPALYFIEHKELNSNTSVRLLALKDALTNPTFVTFTLNVPSYGPPGDPPQAGTGSRVNTFDARFWNVAYRGGSLWATHHVNAARAVARWYEVRMNGWPESGQDPVLVQSGDIDPGEGIWTTFSAITVDEAGAAAMVFCRSATNEPYTMATALRLPCDPPGTFRAPVSEKVSTGPYTQGRWGDYASVEPDPAEPGKFWAIHEYAINNSWRAWIAPITAEACKADLNCDGILDLFDFLAFNNLFNAQDPRADCDGADGVFNLFDFLCYVNLFNEGC
jgi:hypothetical protein